MAIFDGLYTVSEAEGVALEEADSWRRVRRSLGAALARSAFMR
jgi:hypothetical protein